MLKGTREKLAITLVPPHHLHCPLSTGEGNGFGEWNVAWLAERHNYAEFNSWKMGQRNKSIRKACTRLFRAFFGAKFEGAIARLN